MKDIKRLNLIMGWVVFAIALVVYASHWNQTLVYGTVANLPVQLTDCKWFTLPGRLYF